MTAKTTRMVGNVLVFGAVVVLAIDLAAMIGWLADFHERRNLWMLAFIFLVLARNLRRRAARSATSF